MARNHFQFLLVSLLLFALIGSGSCLKCYFCLLARKDECNFDTHVLCKDTQVCIKRTTDANIIFPEFINKGCGDRNFCNEEDLIKSPGYCTTCEHDLCNSSMAVLPSFAVIAIIFIKDYFL